MFFFLTGKELNSKLNLPETFHQLPLQIPYIRKLDWFDLIWLVKSGKVWFHAGSTEESSSVIKPLFGDNACL